MTTPRPLPCWLAAASRVLRAVPSGIPGKIRLASGLLRRFGIGAVQLRHNAGCLLRLPSAAEPMALHLFANGTYEPQEQAVLSRWCQRGGWLVDVGANVGLHTLPLLMTNAQVRVLALEPVSAIIDTLRANLHDAGLTARAVLHRVACGAADGSTRIHVAPDEIFGMSSLAALGNFACEDVPMKTLDSLVLDHSIVEVSAVKVDVEGAEALVFEGGRSLMTGPAAPPILFEFCDWAERNVEGLRPGAAQQTLRDYGYVLFDLPSYLAGGKPLNALKTSGSASLIALPERMLP